MGWQVVAHGESHGENQRVNNSPEGATCISNGTAKHDEDFLPPLSGLCAGLKSIPFFVAGLARV